MTPASQAPALMTLVEPSAAKVHAVTLVMATIRGQELMAMVLVVGKRLMAHCRCHQLGC